MELKPNLIQRCFIKTRSKKDINGVDSFFRYDYMGASEFEWGALGKSLKTFISVADDLVVELAASKGDRKLYVVCAKDDLAAVIKMAKMTCEKNFYALEYTGIKEYLNDKERAHLNPEAWWDIEHRWMAFKNSKDAKLAIYAVQQVRDKRKAEGKL